MMPDSSDITLHVKAKLRVRGEILLSRGEVTKAIEMFIKAHDMDSPIHETSYLGRALLMSGDLEEAHELYKRMSHSEAHLWITMQTVHSPGL
jgi:pentatricopeptide repeat protein